MKKGELILGKKYVIEFANPAENVVGEYIGYTIEINKNKEFIFRLENGYYAPVTESELKTRVKTIKESEVKND